MLMTQSLEINCSRITNVEDIHSKIFAMFEMYM